MTQNEFSKYSLKESNRELFFSIGLRACLRTASSRDANAKPEMCLVGYLW